MRTAKMNTKRSRGNLLIQQMITLHIAVVFVCCCVFYTKDTHAFLPLLYAPQHYTQQDRQLSASTKFTTSDVPVVSAMMIQRRRQAQQRSFSTFINPLLHRTTSVLRSNANNNDNEDLPSFDLPEDEAERLQRQAEQLRQQIRDMEVALEQTRRRKQQQEDEAAVQAAMNNADDGYVDDINTTSKPLRNKRILVVGANGRLGSLVCRYLLRNHPEIKEVVAAVHVVSENSPTSRGYGRLSYEVGAEDGIGSIGPAWSNVEERTATFQYNGEVMGDYNLHKLRIVECELLDPNQCNTICTNIDTVIWCATDFNGNTPRAVSGLNVAFLFRALASPLKGRVEIEGLQNILNAITLSQQDMKRRIRTSATTTSSSSYINTDNRVSLSNNSNIQFVLVSMIPETYTNYETPFGEFNGLKRQGEILLQTEYPSLSYTIVQMGQYDDNFITDNTEPVIITKIKKQQQQNDDDEATIMNNNNNKKERRLIHRRDAAKAIVDDVLNNPTEYMGQVIQLHTTTRPQW